MKRTIASCVGIAVLALSGAAFANPITVTSSVNNGSRQFYVENAVTGAPLGALSVDRSGQAMFRVRVQDNAYGFVPSGGSTVDSSQEPAWQVQASMGEMYLENGSSYNYAEAIPSSAVSLSYPTSPFTHLGNSLSVEPSYLLSGLSSTLPTCATLSTSVPALAPVLALPAAVNLCAVLGSGASVSSVPVAGPLLSVAIPALASVADLPEQLSGNQSGPFTIPDYSGIGANDPGKPASPPTPTTLVVMSGQPGLSATLKSTIAAALQAATPGFPVVTGTDTGSLVPMAGVLAGLQSGGDGALANALSLIGQGGASDAADEAAVINALLSATPVAATVQSLAALDGSYVAFPILNVDLSKAPATGSYHGTMTVTFVQP